MAVVAVFLAALVAAWSAEAETILLEDNLKKIDLAEHWQVLRDQSGTLTIDDMVRPEIAARFQPLMGDLAAGYDLAPHWLRFDVQRSPASRQQWLLEVEMPYLDHVELFSPDGSGSFSAIKTGDRTPFSTRPVSYRTFVFKPDFPIKGPHSFYLRIQSTSTVLVSAKIWSDDGFVSVITRESLLYGLVNGCMLAIILFAGFQYGLNRDSLYLYFSLYVASIEALHLSLSGYAAQYIVTNTPLASDGIVGVTVCISIGSGLIFTAKILDMKDYFKKAYMVYVCAGYTTILLLISVFNDTYHYVAKLINFVVLITLPITVGISVILSIRGHQSARYILASSLIYLLSIGILVLRVLGLYSAPPFSMLATQATAVPHMMLLVLGLLHRSAGIDATRLGAMRRSERYLERRIAERTTELAETNAALAAEVTERRMAEDRLRESERHVRAILDAAPFPMMVVSYPEGRFMFINQPAAELTNIEPETASTYLTTDFYVNIEERRHMMGKLRETGCVLGAELLIRRLPDEQRWTLLSAVRFTYLNQDAVLVCLNDISTRKKLEESLRLASLRSETALEAGHQAMREQRNFLSMISHEFRVPLAIIEAASQLVGIYTKSDDEAQDEVSKIGRAVRRMSDLIDVCLADDRLESNSMSLRIGPCALDQTLADLCDDKQPFVGNRHLRLKVDQATIIHADETLLRVAFSNLIDNALKFSPPDSPVEVRIAGDTESVMVSVSDRGPGISLEEQPRIFEKFFRSTKADRIRGAGLGLYIVRRIVDLHGGSIAVDSLPGRGATFVVWLPIHQQESRGEMVLP